MTLSEIVELVAEEIGAERHVVWGFVRSFMDTLVSELDQGNEVKVQRLGTFRWVDVPEKKMPRGIYAPEGQKLRFFPAKKFKQRR